MVINIKGYVKKSEKSWKKFNLYSIFLIMYILNKCKKLIRKMEF